MKMFRKEEGFTLIELMVVVLIIGILVAIAIPVFNSAKTNSQRKSCYANERTIEGALHSYEASTGALPASTVTYTTLMTAAYLNPGGATDAYLASTPKCPGQGTYTYTVTGSDAQITCSNAVVNGTATATEHGHF